MNEWLSAPQIAALSLPGFPTSKGNMIARAKRERWNRPEWFGYAWRNRKGRGGGIEFNVKVILGPKATIVGRREVSQLDEALACMAELARLTASVSDILTDGVPSSDKRNEMKRLAKQLHRLGRRAAP